MMRARELTFPLVLPFAEALCWRPENIAEATAALLVDLVPGLTITVRPSYTDAGGLELVGRYACPCGEISGLGRMWDEGEIRRAHYPLDLWARAEAERLREWLREHVIEEGNEPGF
jgi:hypothetical protein